MRSKRDGACGAIGTKFLSAQNGGFRPSRRYRPAVESIESRELLAQFGLPVHGVFDSGLIRAVPAVASPPPATDPDVQSSSEDQFSDSAATCSTTESTTAADKVPDPLTGDLASYSDSGESNTDRVTNVTRPTFLGTADPWAMVQVYAVEASSWPTNTRLLGQTIAGCDGSWSITSTLLPDGSYAVTGVQTPQRKSPSSPSLLIGSLTIDTTAPRVAGLAFNPRNGTVTTVISDVGSGVLERSAMDAANYTVVPPSTLIGAHPGRGGSGGPISAPSISGFYSDASAYTIQLDFGGGQGRGWSRGRYLFQVRSGGVVDRAGNAMDGEFTGNLPSGDGAPGGNFIAKLINNQSNTPRRGRLALNRRR